MTSQINILVGGFSSFISATIGSRALPMMAVELDPLMPDWIRVLLGPLGALIGLIIALWWMVQRLNKAEKRFEERDKERDSDRRALILVVEQNSQALHDVGRIIGKCRGE